MPFDHLDTYRGESIHNEQELEQRAERYAQRHPAGDEPGRRPNMLQRLIAALGGKRSTD